ncbi:ubiquitin-like protein 3 isoform X3 [Pteropus medius]|uniref:ubiquitin-like protein 3 isoform X3 n=1 Tax=Pteropus vampyrus TaxID=132908 RepID=UPI00196B707F|nr:ubiquitin-like protein 3 isoform X3 [Pteropus giganteus]XP_039730278.1 ubiquitin-like protein 3 isoform X3 [Pteropus giganteus]
MQGQSQNQPPEEQLFNIRNKDKMSSNVPADMINLHLILVSGKTKEFLFSRNDSALDIAKHVYDNPPMDWEEEQVNSPNVPRLIYQGWFLHGNVTLGALKLPFGKTTVMHLVASEMLLEPNFQGQRNREKMGESNCCVIL